MSVQGRRLMALGGTAMLLVLVTGSAAAEGAARARPRRSPLREPVNLVFSGQPVTVRMDVPPEILAEVRDTTNPSPRPDYGIYFQGITRPANEGTGFTVFVGRGATTWTPPEDKRYVGYAVFVAHTERRDRPPIRTGGSFTVTREQLRRYVLRRNYFPLKLVARPPDPEAPRRRVLLRIERIYLKAPPQPERTAPAPPQDPPPEGQPQPAPAPPAPPPPPSP